MVFAPSVNYCCNGSNNSSRNSNVLFHSFLQTYLSVHAVASNDFADFLGVGHHHFGADRAPRRLARACKRVHRQVIWVVLPVLVASTAPTNRGPTPHGKARFGTVRIEAMQRARRVVLRATAAAGAGKRSVGGGVAAPVGARAANGRRTPGRGGNSATASAIIAGVVDG